MLGELIGQMKDSTCTISACVPLAKEPVLCPNGLCNGYRPHACAGMPTCSIPGPMPQACKVTAADAQSQILLVWLSCKLCARGNGQTQRLMSITPSQCHAIHNPHYNVSPHDQHHSASISMTSAAHKWLQRLSVIAAMQL